jgi:hypothetical protein
MNSQTIFLVIPSNSQAESYPENKTSNFTIPLPYHPESGKWKVALLEIQIPITFYNLDDSYSRNRFTLEDGDRISIGRGHNRRNQQSNSERSIEIQTVQV